MRHLEAYRIIWVVLFCGLTLLVCSYPASAQRLSFQEAFEKAKTDWEMELPYNKGYFYTCDDGFLFSAQDRTGVYRYNLQGVKLWEKIGVGISAVGISQDGRFALLVRYERNKRYPGRYYEYLDAEGNVLWRIRRHYEEGPYLSKISRVGKYLINVEDPMSGREVLTVWDGKSGEVLWQKEGEMSPWKAEFAREERIAYYHDVTLHLLDSATGDVIWSRDLRPFLPKPFGGVEDRELFVSDDGSKIAVAMEGTKEKSLLVLCDENGNVLWTKDDFNFSPSGAVFSRSARNLLIKDGSFWILVDAASGREAWRIKKKVSHHFNLPGTGRIFFEDNAIFVASHFHGTAILELDEKSQIRRYSHFDERIFVFPQKGLPSVKKAIMIEKGQNRLKISRRTVNIGRKAR